MLISPLQNKGVLIDNTWIQKRPHITQNFGENPHIYDQFGIDGHNGLDLRARTPLKLFAPFEGTVKCGNQGGSGYGRYIRIFKDNLELILAHLSSVNVVTGDIVHLGDKIGETGNTGFSTGPHLHIGLRFRDDDEIVDYENGYHGYVDPAPYLITWKGSFTKTTI